MATRLKLAVAGTGYFAQFHYEAWSRIENVDLVGLCTLDGTMGRKIADRFDVDTVYGDVADMLDACKPDLLDIATPPPTHRQFIEVAVSRGVAVVCQKPFTESLADAEAVTHLAEDAGVPLIVHENFRFQPWHRQARKILDEGTLGEVYQVSFRMRPGDGQGPEAYLDRQPYFQTMDRFLVHETAIHFIDVFRYLLGEVSSVYADLARYNPAIAGEDAGYIVFNFKSRVRGLFDGNRLVDHAAENRRLTMGEMLIEGSESVLRLDGDGNMYLRKHGYDLDLPVDYDWENRGFAGDSVYMLLRHVVEHVRAGAPAMNTARDYLRNLRIEDAVYRSSESGAKVAL
tara:strand:+ start:778 stop:1806 length:1029 start_codon:yes stop_codon:yes gene_type:complete